MSGRITILAPDGVPEIGAGDDLVGHLVHVAETAGATLRDGDIVTVTSKVVSKAEGQVRPGTRDDAIDDETHRVVARRGATAIVRTRLGLTMAAAGIDASNVKPGHIVLHPRDPDASARKLRADVLERAGANVGVVVTDTAGRAWRDGQTDIAIGAAGIGVLEDYAGRDDGYGNPLAVTAPAVADEIAGMAELAQGKLGARPFTIVTGRADLVLAPDDDGPGASALIRPEGRDFFGYGAREAVIRALAGQAEDAAPFGDPAETGELVAAISEVLDVAAVPQEDGSIAVATTHGPVLDALAYAHGWAARPIDAATSSLSPRTP